MTLDVRNLHYSYKKNEVLKGVDFSINAGQCVCVLGENGAGKTTLFRCLTGLLKDYKGEIYIDGINGKKLSVRETSKKIAYIPQVNTLAFNYTVFEIVLMGTNALTAGFRSPGDGERNTVHQTLEKLNISHLLNRGYSELSGGERQLTLISRALAQKSRILIMDEPAANLDYGNQFRVMRQVKSLTESGYLVVLSTHNPEHALLYADKVLVIKNGKAAVFGEPETVLDAEMIKDVYNVSVEIKNIDTPDGGVKMVVPYL